jgi:hypothetical protein
LCAAARAPPLPLPAANSAARCPAAAGGTTCGRSRSTSHQRPRLWGPAEIQPSGADGEPTATLPASADRKPPLRLRQRFGNSAPWAPRRCPAHPSARLMALAAAAYLKPCVWSQVTGASGKAGVRCRWGSDLHHKFTQEWRTRDCPGKAAPATSASAAWVTHLAAGRFQSRKRGQQAGCATVANRNCLGWINVGQGIPPAG